MALSKKYKEAAAKIEVGKSYAPLEAVALVKEIATANFDISVLVSIPVRLISSSVVPLASPTVLVKLFA